MPSPSSAADAAVTLALRRLADDAPQWLGQRRAVLTPLGREERPFSTVLKVALRPQDGEGNGFNVFLKVFKPKDHPHGIDLHERVRRDFTTTQALFDFMAPWPDTGVVRPLACYEDLLALVTQETVGVTLLERLHKDATWFSHATVERLSGTMGLVGRWLGRFQAFQPGNCVVTPEALAVYVDVRLRRLVERGVLRSEERARILSYVETQAAHADAGERREVAVHADLAPANVLVSASGVVVLDLAMAGRGSRLQDVSRLYMQLDVLRAKPQFRPSTIRKLQAALLAGLDPALGEHEPLFRSALMVHRVNHLGTLALGRESGLARLFSARVVRLHRRAIAAALDAPGEPA